MSETAVARTCVRCKETFEVSPHHAARRNLCEDCRSIVQATKRSKRPPARHSAVTRPLTVAEPTSTASSGVGPPAPARQGHAASAPRPPAGIREESSCIEYVRVGQSIARPPHADLVPLRLVTTPLGSEEWEEAPAEDETTTLYWRRWAA